MNFEQLLKRAKNKDPEAKEQLYEMFRPLLIHQAMISGRFSEDLYQELSLTFLFCIDSFKIEKALRLIKDNENRQKKSKNKGLLNAYGKGKIFNKTLDSSFEKLLYCLLS